MIKSCVKIKPVTGGSENHNTREVKPKYLIPSEVENIHIVDAKIEDVRKEIEKKYIEKYGFLYDQNVLINPTPFIITNNNRYNNFFNSLIVILLTVADSSFLNIKACINSPVFKLYTTFQQKSGMATLFLIFLSP